MLRDTGWSTRISREKLINSRTLSTCTRRAFEVVRLTNAAVGPARMKGLRMVIAGEVVHDCSEAAVAADFGADAFRY